MNTSNLNVNRRNRSKKQKYLDRMAYVETKVFGNPVTSTSIEQVKNQKVAFEVELEQINSNNDLEFGDDPDFEVNGFQADENASPMYFQSLNSDRDNMQTNRQLLPDKFK